jgi:hypothetical protein
MFLFNQLDEYKESVRVWKCKFFRHLPGQGVADCVLKRVGKRTLPTLPNWRETDQS